MSLMEHDMRSAESADFNPLVEFAGMWNMRLAEDFRAFLGARFGKWECIHGRLVVAPPTEASNNSWGEAQLAGLLGSSARRGGFFVYLSLNMAFDPDTWLQPDLNVLHRVPAVGDRKTWVPADHFTMPIEFVSVSTKHRDEHGKPQLLASAGVPYYMIVEIDPMERTVAVTQLKLSDGRYREIARATEGVFTMVEPFEVSFDVAELLEPEPSE
jgi:Putative restriction endonuclease